MSVDLFGNRYTDEAGGAGRDDRVLPGQYLESRDAEGNRVVYDWEWETWRKLPSEE